LLYALKAFAFKVIALKAFAFKAVALPRSHHVSPNASQS
jgi:hypothetical protein